VTEEEEGIIDALSSRLAALTKALGVLNERTIQIQRTSEGYTKEIHDHLSMIQGYVRDAFESRDPRPRHSAGESWLGAHAEPTVKASGMSDDMLTMSKLMEAKVKLGDMDIRKYLKARKGRPA
jgi:hypothetical protein